MQLHFSPILWSNCVQFHKITRISLTDSDNSVRFRSGACLGHARPSWHILPTRFLESLPCWNAHLPPRFSSLADESNMSFYVSLITFLSMPVLFEEEQPHITMLPPLYITVGLAFLWESHIQPYFFQTWQVLVLFCLTRVYKPKRVLICLNVKDVHPCDSFFSETFWMGCINGDDCGAVHCLSFSVQLFFLLLSGHPEILFMWLLDSLFASLSLVLQCVVKSCMTHLSRDE